MTPHFLESPHRERYLHDVNRDAFVRRPSSEVFERLFGMDLDAPNVLYVIVGSDSGLLVRWLADRTLGTGSRLLFVELDDHADIVRESLADTLAAATEEHPIEVCDASAWEDALAACNPGLYLYGGRILVLESVGCTARYAEGYAPLARSVRLSIGELVHAAGMRINTRTFVDVQMRNAADNLVPAASVGRIGEDRTAIVLGGGPSLDRDLEWVLEHRESLFVIAVSRIAGKLAGIGLIPDVVAAVDPQEILFDISKEGLRLEGIPLVAAYHACSTLVQQWRGPTLYTGRALPWDTDATGDADNIVSQGSTVSHAALWLAFRWGFSQILLSGVDLCYAPGGGTHASGSVESLCATLPASYDVQVVTYDGRRAGTAMPLKLGRDELEHMGRAIASGGAALYNLAADAARVDSIEHRPAGEIVLEGARPRLELGGDGPRVADRLKLVRKELADARRGLHDVRRHCVEARRCLDGLHGRGGRAPDYRFKHKLDAVERTLDKRCARWMRLIRHYGAFDFARSVAPSGFDAMSDAELERWGRDYYRIVDDNAKRLCGLVESASERLAHRQLELRADASVTALVEYWSRDGTLGRVERVFGDRHEFSDDAARDAVTRARLEHAARLEEVDTGFARHHAANKTNAAKLLHTIALLFDEGDAADLGLLRDGLRSMGGDWSLFAAWAAGRHVELAGEPCAALEHYREVLDRHSELAETGTPVPSGAERLLEDVLIRIVHLQLEAGDGESALAGLTILAELSPGYVPRRAKLLSLLGRRDEAAQALQDLLAEGGGDWRIAEQLAELYAEQGAAEAAGVAASLARRLRDGVATEPCVDGSRAA